MEEGGDTGNNKQLRLTFAKLVRSRMRRRRLSRSALSVGSSAECSEAVAGIANESAGEGDVADDDGVAMAAEAIRSSRMCATRRRV